MAYFWQIEADDDGVLIKAVRKNLLGGARAITPQDWPQDSDLPGCALLSYLVDAEEARTAADGVRLSHERVAALSEDQANLLGLPPSVPLALSLKSHGTLNQEDFAVSSKWLRFGSVAVNLKVQGAIACENDKNYRVPLALMRILDAVSEFDAADTSTRERRIELWMPIEAALHAATGAKIQPDGYLADLKIFYASSLSLSVNMEADRGVTFDPVLFGRAAVNRVNCDPFEADPMADPALADDVDDAATRNGIDTLVDESDQLLPPALHEIFLRKRLARDDQCRSAYPLERNAYVVFDTKLRRALDVVKRKQTGSEDERRDFVKNPRAVLASELGYDADAPEALGLFVETQQYADRVTGIGLWSPKVLAWLPKASNSWLPEKIGFRIGDRTVELNPENLDDIKQACERAMDAGEPTFYYAGAKDIPAGPETLTAIETLRTTAERLLKAQTPTDQSADDASSGDAAEKPEEKSSDRIALEQDDNLEELRYSLGLEPRTSTIDQAPPKQLIDPNHLYPHQREGFDWMVKSWAAGRPGVLLADDMGLGKTVQMLAFAAWLQVQLESGDRGSRGPFLIVAPTALLGNWRAEHDLHLHDGGIGPIVELYGGAVAAFRKKGEHQRDVVAGRGTIDRDALSSASVILTTYETLANYHISFAAVRFPLIVFDEIQKLKTPTTINTHAAKTLNADFVVGLTGTPVENNLTEIWSIMDRLSPGLLDDLKSFNRRYVAGDIAAIRELRDVLAKPVADVPSVMLRRMKDATDLGKALPPRKFHSLPCDMPEPQAKSYETCVTEARRDKAAGANRGAMLQVLQRMRGISLHPDHPSTVLGRPELYDGYIAQSARLETVIKILDDIQARGEKGLIFIEYREMQNVIADIVRHRYGLDRLPAIINGQTPSAKRQALVSEFQARPRGLFDVMVLAPRAAGVGLNITAANHVIHLSRWWNPAVEDQCNDRVYRIGQNKPVSVYCPIARHPAFGDASFDVTLDNLLNRKRSLSRDLLLPMETDEDYRNIFESTVSGTSA